MKNGGYQIIDFMDTPFTDSITQYIPNVYSQLESTRKATLISGLNFEGEELKDMFVNFAVYNSNYVGYYNAKGHTYKITVGASVDGTDPITITDEGSMPA